MNLSDNKRFHFVGIGGAGMSGLADILIEMGHKVSGSDREQSEVTDYLKRRGAKISIGHNTTNLEDVDYLVYSSAIPEDNPERIEATKKNIPLIRRAEMLGKLMNKKRGIAIAGTHGKTTTTSIIGQMLIGNNMDPTIVVGGKMADSQTNARLGKGDFFVTEADEYDRSFLTLYPEISVVTSLEEDHLDIYQDMTNLKNTFIKFTNQTASDGLVVLNADDENVTHIATDVVTRTQSYGLNKIADIQAKNISFKDGKTFFKVYKEGSVIGSIHLKIPGNHNISNALAAISVGMNLGIPFDKIETSLAAFNGVQRRFEFKGESKGILFYDDYAHHPTEVKAAINAAKSGWKNRLVVVFQPHLFSRTRDFYRGFAHSLMLADKVILTPVYPARETEIPGVSHLLIAEEMDERCIALNDNSLIKDRILEEIKEGDLVVTMGAGDIWKFGEMVYKALESGE